jgi:hypothetical protein
LKRADINPAELKEMLPDILFFAPVYDSVGTVVDAVIKLQGTRAASFYGELTDKRVSDHPNPQVGERVIASVRHVVENRDMFQGEATAEYDEKTYMKVKAMYVPMAEDNETIDRLLVYLRVSYEEAYAGKNPLPAFGYE